MTSELIHAPQNRATGKTTIMIRGLVEWARTTDPKFMATIVVRNVVNEQYVREQIKAVCHDQCLNLGRIMSQINIKTVNDLQQDSPGPVVFDSDVVADLIDAKKIVEDKLWAIRNPVNSWDRDTV